MKVDIRQGLIVPKTSNNYLVKSTNGINLQIVDPIYLVFAHGNANYLFKLNSNNISAWSNNFLSTSNYWFYWDIDVETAKLSYGYTEVEPLVGKNLPSSPNIDQHYFDINTGYMQVWDGHFWVEKIRVFAGSLKQNELSTIGYTSQINMFGEFNASPIQFYNNEPVRMELNNNHFKFITTDDLNTVIDNFKINPLDNSIIASENITQYSAVAVYNETLVNVTNLDNTKEVYGIAPKDIAIGDKINVIKKGFIEDESKLSFNVPANTPLYINSAGKLTTFLDSSAESIQKVGYVVALGVIYVDIGPQMLVIQPTPLPTFTPTISLTPTNTITPTVTPTVTVTPTITPTPS